MAYDITYEIVHNYDEGSTSTTSQFIIEAEAAKTTKGYNYEKGKYASWQFYTSNSNFTMYYFLFDGHIWIRMSDAVSYLKELGPSSALNFEKTIDSNFKLIGTNVDYVSDNIKRFDETIKDVARTSNAADVIPDETHEFVTDTQINNWNNRAFITNDGSTVEKIYSGTQELTNWPELVNASIPTKTSDLENNSSFIVGSSYDDYTMVYSEDVMAYYNASYNNGKMVVDLNGCTSSMIPVIYFEDADAQSGNFSTVCESGENCVSFERYNDASSVRIPLVFAISKNQIKYNKES